jgi:hypothetical protein
MRLSPAQQELNPQSKHLHGQPSRVLKPGDSARLGLTGHAKTPDSGRSLLIISSDQQAHRGECHQAISTLVPSNMPPLFI